jgi:hypothetical protein
MIKETQIIEDFRRTQFNETVTLLEELNECTTKGLGALAEYSFRDNDEAYQMIYNIRGEYRGIRQQINHLEGMMDPSRPVAGHEKQIAIKKNIGKKKLINDAMKPQYRGKTMRMLD